MHSFATHAKVHSRAGFLASRDSASNTYFQRSRLPTPAVCPSLWWLPAGYLNSKFAKLVCTCQCAYREG